MQIPKISGPLNNKTAGSTRDFDDIVNLSRCRMTNAPLTLSSQIIITYFKIGRWSGASGFLVKMAKSYKNNIFTKVSKNMEILSIQGSTLTNRLIIIINRLNTFFASTTCIGSSLGFKIKNISPKTYT